jgi:hypothetical protein
MEALDETELAIGSIRLRWSPWVPWQSILLDARRRGGIAIPNRVPGVYEVRYTDGKEERLTIGKAGDLRWRIRQGLVKGIAPHSTGNRIRAVEDTSRLVVRWAETDRPACAEEELHRRYRARFGRLPTYTLRT